MESPQPKYVKGSCGNCGGHFEFDESWAGNKIQCPHCGRETELVVPALPSIRIEGQMVAHPPPQPAPSPQPALASASSSLAGGPRYFTGGSVQLGDRVRYKGVFGTVVVISNGDQTQCALGYDDYSGQDAGVLICDDDGDTTLVHEDDEQLELVHH